MVSQQPIVDRLDTRKLHFVDVDGIRTRYYEDGSGEPLVLIHGGEYGSLYSLDCWSLNLPGLAERFHVYAIDKLGQGQTGNPKTDEDFTVDALERHMIGTLRALGIERAHLVGHSRGAWLIAYLALRYDGLAKSLVCIDTSTLAPDDPRYPSGPFYDAIEARIPPGPPTIESVRLEPDAQTYHKDRVTDDFLSRLLENARLPKTREIAEQNRAGGKARWMASLNQARAETLRMIDERGLPAPTLLIWGQNDVSAPVQLAYPLFERIAARTPRAELHIFNHAMHYVFRDWPEEFNRLVINFCLG